MSIEDNGGAAFPRPFSNDTFNDDTELAQRGMMLRDYFAAKAVVAFITTAPGGTEFGVSHSDTNGGYAKAAYAMADAMLEARKK